MESAMKTLVLISAAAMLAAFTSPAWAEPYAPKVDVPEEMLEPTHPNAFDAMMTKNARVPSREEVGIPPYPGAEIVHTQQPSGATVNGKEITPNHMISMGSADPVDRVLDFYRRELSGWSGTKQMGIHVLYQGEGEFELMDASSMTTPHVQVRKAYPDESPVMPGMKTVIEVYYRP
jgi:hypothetical protein